MEGGTKARLRQRFHELDSNGDGMLSFDELKLLLGRGDAGLSDTQLRLLFDGVDRDGSGKIDFDEFMDFLYSEEPEAPVEWFDAAMAGNERALARLASSVHPDVRDVRTPPRHLCCRGFTALMYAAAEGHEACVRLLADGRAALDLQDLSLGDSAAMLAAEGGRAGCVALLAERRADVNLSDRGGSTALMLAVLAREPSPVEVLADRGADLNQGDSHGWTPVMAAARTAQYAIVRKLLERRGEVNRQNAKGQTPLMLAVMACDERSVRTLMAFRADLLLKDSHGRTAAMEAAQRRHATCEQIMKRARGGARLIGLLFPGSPKSGGSSPCAPSSPVASEEDKSWFRALWSGDVAAVRDRVSQGLDLEAVDEHGWTALMIASITDSRETLQLLVGGGSNLEAQDTGGRTPIMLAATKGHARCVDLLAMHGACLNARDSRCGETAAILAAQAGSAECLKALRRRGADMDLRREDGCTAPFVFLLATGRLLPTAPERQPDPHDEAAGAPPSPSRSVSPRPPDALEESLARERERIWLRAAHYQQADVLRRLIKAGHASLNIEDSRGKTAAMVAAQFGDAESVGVLVRAGADLNIQESFFGRTALAFASEAGHMSCIKLLIDQGEADADRKDCYRRSALMEAALNGHDRCVRFLARRGAAVDPKDTEGSTPAGLAAAAGHVACLRVLAEQDADLITRTPDGPPRNALHAVERLRSFEDALSAVPTIDWRAAVTGGAQSLCDALSAASAASGFAERCFLAGLHFFLWEVDMWGSLHVRDQLFADALLDCVETFLEHSKDCSLSKQGKKALTLALDAGILRALSAERRRALMDLNSAVLRELETALDYRQEALSIVAGLTSQPDTYFRRWDRFDRKTSGKLDQRDAMPDELWTWLVDLPGDSAARLELAYHALHSLGIAPTPAAFANYLRKHDLLSDSALYSRAAAHVLVSYAAIVNDAFVAFMADHFELQFHAAPVKKLPRIFNKLAADEPRLSDEAAAADSAELRCAYFGLGDLVRGSVRANGPKDMVQIIKQLQSLTRMTTHGKFEVWRIKNTHHPEAEDMTGGYRDVKLLGRFTARRRLHGSPFCMIVEVQVIDTVYMDIKQHMHKAYAIARGDYD